MALAANAASANDETTLTGCLIRGEGDGGGYLLVNTPAVPGSANTDNARVAPGTLGTSSTFTHVFYWLDNDSDLKPHVGHRVEVEGEAKGQVNDGEMTIQHKEQWTEIEIESDGRAMKAQVPNPSILAPQNHDRKIQVLVKKVDVHKVRMLAATCQ
jgi:hypothetical protein